MKLRIKGDSLRLRLTRPELARLEAGDEVAETIHFGAAAEESLRYRLAAAEQDAPVAVGFGAHTISVTISLEKMGVWADESEVGVYAELETGAGGRLEVAVEKDFKCLDRRDEQDEDAFPNPQAGKTC